MSDTENNQNSLAQSSEEVPRQPDPAMSVASGETSCADVPTQASANMSKQQTDKEDDNMKKSDLKDIKKYFDEELSKAIDNLKEDLKEEVIKKVISDVDESIKDVKDKLKNKIDSCTNSIAKMIDDKLNNVSNQITEQVRVSESNQRKIIAELNNKIKTQAQDDKREVITKISDVESHCINTITETNDKLITELKKANDFYTEKISKIMEDYTMCFNWLKDWYRNYNEQKLNSAKQVNNVLIKIDELARKQNERDTQMENILEHIGALTNAVQNELQQEKAHVTSVSNELQQEKERCTSISNELQKVKDLFTEEQKKTTQLQEERTQLDAAIKAKTDEYAALQEKYAAFNPFMKQYRDIFSLAVKCSSLAPLFSELDKASPIKALLQFLLIFGTDTEFAAKVYTTMRETKKQSKEPLTDDEQALIKKLNEFYSANPTIGFEPFEIIQSDGPVKFDKTKMQDINDILGMFRTVSSVYVPVLKKDKNTVTYKAVVKGEK